ncbi:hypothetical protein ACM67F_06930 [Neisseria polysaccharea]
MKKKENALVKAKNDNELEKIADFSEQLIELMNKFIETKSQTDLFFTNAVPSIGKDALRKK